MQLVPMGDAQVQSLRLGGPRPSRVSPAEVNQGLLEPPVNPYQLGPWGLGGLGRIRRMDSLGLPASLLAAGPKDHRDHNRRHKDLEHHHDHLHEVSPAKAGAEPRWTAPWLRNQHMPASNWNLVVAQPPCRRQAIRRTSHLLSSGIGGDAFLFKDDTYSAFNVQDTSPPGYKYKVDFKSLKTRRCASLKARASPFK